MDQEGARAMLEELGGISDVELVDTDPDTGSWLLNAQGTAMAVELAPDGATLRLIAELGIEPDRALEVLANTELCRAMLRFNGDRLDDAMWLGLQPDDPSFLLTRQLLTEDLNPVDLAARVGELAEMYDAWFEVVETVMGGNGTPEDQEPPPSPGAPWVRV